MGDKPKKKIKLSKEARAALAMWTHEGHEVTKRVFSASHRAKQLPDDDMVQDVLHDMKVHEPYHEMRKKQK